MKKVIVLPLIVGLFLGAISVIYSKIPAPVANWSGMRVIANQIGYYSKRFFAGDIFEVVLAFALTTVIFILFLRKIIKETKV
ncbi:MAG: hypothetical protein FWH08_05770 [Oscillospiraceae bacterium]|nr:hypothetical protein [Oscillospiraceae bacterium]